MKDFRSSRIGIKDAADLLRVRVSELRRALQEGSKIEGVDPPAPMYKSGGKDGREGGWVFLAGDVMDVYEKIQKTKS